MEQKELIYESPEVEVIEVEVEQGFQASGEKWGTDREI